MPKRLPKPMTFACPQCGQHLATETIYRGQVVKCPKCGREMTIPDTAPAPTPQRIPADLAKVKKDLQSNIDHGAMTLTKFMPTASA